MGASQVLVSFDGWVLGTEPFWNLLRWLQLLFLAFYVLGL